MNIFEKNLNIMYYILSSLKLGLNLVSILVVKIKMQVEV